MEYRYKEEHYPVIKAMLDMQKFYAGKYEYKTILTNKHKSEDDGFSRHNYIEYRNIEGERIEFRFRFEHPRIDIHFPKMSGLVSLEYGTDGKFIEAQIFGEIGVEKFKGLKEELDNRIINIISSKK